MARHRKTLGLDLSSTGVTISLSGFSVLDLVFLKG